MLMSAVDERRLELFYEYGEDFPFLSGEDDVELIEKWVPDYIKEGDLYRSLVGEKIIVKKKYFPMYVMNIDFDFDISLFNPEYFVSFLIRFEYWGCKDEWLLNMSLPYIHKILYYIYINSNYFKMYTSNEKINIINYFFLNIINTIDIESKEELLMTLYIRNTFIPYEYWARDFRNILVNNPILIAECEQYVGSNYTEECYLLRKYLDYIDQLYDLSFNPNLNAVSLFVNKYSISPIKNRDIFLEESSKILNEIILRFGVDYKINNNYYINEENKFVKESEKHTVIEHTIMRFLDFHIYIDYLLESKLFKVIIEYSNENLIDFIINYYFYEYPEVPDDTYLLTTNLKSTLLNIIVSNNTQLKTLLENKYKLKLQNNNIEIDIFAMIIKNDYPKLYPKLYPTYI